MMSIKDDVCSHAACRNHNHNSDFTLAEHTITKNEENTLRAAVKLYDHLQQQNKIFFLANHHNFAIDVKKK